MGKNQKRNLKIVEDYDLYHMHMEKEKEVPENFYVIKEKENHPQSYAGSIDVNCEVPYGKTELQCEIREASSYNYSFSYMTDMLKDRILARLDVGNGTHRNRAPGIPLQLTSVPTPHYHYYREDGYFLAFPLDCVDYSSEDAVKFDFYKGYSYLCNQLKFYGNGAKDLYFDFCPEGVLPLLDDGNDPNENVLFDEIE